MGDAGEEPKNRLQPESRRTDCSRRAEEQTVIETQRLLVRPLTPDDAAFVLELVNDPDWLRFIGDKHVQTLDDARDYIQKEGTDKYPLPGLGLNVVALKDSGTPIGICGLKKRDGLDHPDLGFAFLPAHRGRGYAHEACHGFMMQLLGDSGYAHLLAITSVDNVPSIQLLEKLGMHFVSLITLPGANHQVRLYEVVTQLAIASTGE